MSLLSSSLLVSLLALGAQPSGDYAPPCEKAPYTQFDMWVGEWVAFDWETGVVQGIDHFLSNSTLRNKKVIYTT